MLLWLKTQVLSFVKVDMEAESATATATTALADVDDDDDDDDDVDDVEFVPVKNSTVNTTAPQSPLAALNRLRRPGGALPPSNVASLHAKLEQKRQDAVLVPFAPLGTTHSRRTDVV